MFFEIYILLFLLGAIFGSFANVCIYRLPKEQSVVTKGSYCPNCKKKLIGYIIFRYFLTFVLKANVKIVKKKFPFNI